MLYVRGKKARSYSLLDLGRASGVCVGELMVIEVIQCIDDRGLTRYAEDSRCVTACAVFKSACGMRTAGKGLTVLVQVCSCC